MRIGIVGNYGNQNNGDEAILSGIIHQLTHYFGISRQDIVVFSNNPTDTTNRYQIRSAPLLVKKSNILQTLTSTFFSAKKEMKELDMVMIGGGGLLMDMYKRDAPLYTIMGKAAKLSGCKLMIYGVGAGPLKTSLGRSLIKSLVKSADSVSVRDSESKSLLESLNVGCDISIIGDPALLMPPPQKERRSETIQKVGVTAVPYFSSDYWPVHHEETYQKYVTGMASNLDAMINDHQVEVTLFSTKFPQDVKVTEDILSEMKNGEQVTLKTDNLYPNELLKVTSEIDVLIGTRLHSLILSVVSRTPVIGVAYHDKVVQFMKLLDQEKMIQEIAPLSESDQLLSDKLSDMKKHWEDIQSEFMKNADQLEEKAKLGLKLISEVTGYPIKED